mmetsp:Transcript_19187/g.41554  ORF Transcript_19187/g.41554 Transcript_19187/m.41554 type:complete len:200 (+) Transcript_19187:70-669(+)|eukprot:CAMPEP_0172312082 /NCGR_PEP_ID=MMETSP1058-20130122/16600_1 /TAXON_ID=83371 /ORGANISM="Detonula confervacea, Strain CCMP 353" /LENGTH=199 /DNA_ID=CAMNT_0013025433 /DNA_START=60 /DNA_END=659 /DNA_ORIENTATION=-
MMHLLFLFAVISSVLPNGASFSPAPGRISSRAINSTPNNLNLARYSTVAASSSRTTRLHSTDDNQAEIAALEERLKQLKEPESSSSESPPVAKPESTPMEILTADEQDGLEAIEGETEDSVMFSERWKEAKDGYLTKEKEVNMEKNMGGIAKVGLALGLVVLLGLFSQMHVGEEDLQRYQDIKGSTSRIDLGDLNPDSQ